MKPMELLKAAAQPLGVHAVATPELQLAGDHPEDVAAASCQQYLAELSGEEADSFNEIWSDIREKFTSEDTVLMDYRRAAVAFCWCDAERERFHKTTDEVWACVKALRAKPATLTTRMYLVANGANAFSGIDDETKKNSKVQTAKP